MPYPEPPTARRGAADAPRSDPPATPGREFRRAFAARLSPQERLVVMLTYSDRLSQREIAAVLGIPAWRVGQVQAQIAVRCRAMLAGRE